MAKRDRCRRRHPSSSPSRAVDSAFPLPLFFVRSPIYVNVTLFLFVHFSPKASEISCVIFHIRFHPTPSHRRRSDQKKKKSEKRVEISNAHKITFNFSFIFIFSLDVWIVIISFYTHQMTISIVASTKERKSFYYLRLKLILCVGIVRKTNRINRKPFTATSATFDGGTYEDTILTYYTITWPLRSVYVWERSLRARARALFIQLPALWKLKCWFVGLNCFRTILGHILVRRTCAMCGVTRTFWK